MARFQLRLPWQTYALNQPPRWSCGATERGTGKFAARGCGSRREGLRFLGALRSANWLFVLKFIFVQGGGVLARYDSSLGSWGQVEMGTRAAAQTRENPSRPKRSALGQLCLAARRRIGVRASSAALQQPEVSAAARIAVVVVLAWKQVLGPRALVSASRKHPGVISACRKHSSP